MPEKILLNSSDIERALVRVAHEILERNKGAINIVFVGIKTRGVPLAQRLARIIRNMEQVCTTMRAERNRIQPGRYAHPQASFFQNRNRGNAAMSIDEVVAWSRTARGGKHLPILPEPPSGGCFRWGLCERPPTETAEAEEAAD